MEVRQGSNPQIPHKCKPVVGTVVLEKKPEMIHARDMPGLKEE